MWPYTPLAHFYHEKFFFCLQLWQTIFAATWVWVDSGDLSGFEIHHPKLFLLLRLWLEKPAVILMSLPLCVTWPFSLAAFHRLSLLCLTVANFPCDDVRRFFPGSICPLFLCLDTFLFPRLKFFFYNFIKNVFYASPFSMSFLWYPRFLACSIAILKKKTNCQQPWLNGSIFLFCP